MPAETRYTTGAARGLVPSAAGQRAQHVADGDGRNVRRHWDDAEDVAPPPTFELA